MSHWIVGLAGLAAIAWVNWYFFVAGRTAGARARATGTGLEELNIVVHGGYEPAIIEAHAGVPLRLIFDRRETSSCSEEVVFPSFGIRRYLPANQKTVIDLPPATPGTYEFTCGMSMLRGTLKVV